MNNPSITTLKYVGIMILIIGAAFFLKAQIDKIYDNGIYVGQQMLIENCQKAIDNAYSEGWRDNEKHINDYIAQGLIEKGEVKIRYYASGTNEITDVILVPKQ